MQPSVDLSFQCMQTPTLVYAYSNFLKWPPDFSCATKKFFSPIILDYNVTRPSSRESEKRRNWTVNCFRHGPNCNKLASSEMPQLTQARKKKNAFH
jgi:hypothetical protein